MLAYPAESVWSVRPVAPELAQARILVVDDSMTIRKMIAQYLRRGGYEVVTCVANGREALAAMADFPPDLVITDISMPEMDGFELIRHMRASERGAAVPILVQTAATGYDERGAVFLHGATDLITKPINAHEMLGRVRVHLEQRHLVRRLSEYQHSMAQDLDLARGMQESLMPTRPELDSLEVAHGIDIASSYRASIGLGGDMWTLFAAPDGTLHFWAIDFTGHGVAAALNTFRLHALLRSERLAAMGLGEAMAALNHRFKATLPLGQFATVLGLRISILEGWIDLVSAAAPPLLLREGAGGDFRAIEVESFPAGLVADGAYAVTRYQFPRGSALVAYSDALIETPAPPDSIFTPATLARDLSALESGASAATLMRRMLAPFPAYPFEDDLTLVVLCSRGRP